VPFGFKDAYFYDQIQYAADISTAAGLNRFKGALAKLAAREHAIVNEKNAYEGSAAYRNACGAND
jgi:hypothetical protein